MRKHISLSALLSSLLATPLLASPPARPQESLSAEPVVLPASALEEGLVTPDMAKLEEQLRAVSAGEPLDAHGMQRLQKQLAAAMNERLERELVVQRQLARHPQLFQAQFAGPAAVAIRTEKAAFLGVATSPVTPILGEQLNLTRGMGLVVDYIEKDSPADAAGLKVHDILQKLDDQWLINPQQLAVLVRARKPGDTIHFTVIHGGQSVTLAAKLVEKDLPPLENLQDPFTTPGTPLIPMPPRGGPGALAPHASSLSVRRDADGSTTRTLIDDQYNITLNTTSEGNGTLSAKDRDGMTLYNGPAEMAAVEAAKLPAELVGKIEELRKMTGTSGFKSPETAAVGPNGAVSATMVVSRADADHQIVMQGGSEGQTLKVKDVHTGQMLFDGAFHGEEDLKTMPPVLAEKVRALVKRAGVAGG